MFKKALHGLITGQTNLDLLYKIYSWLELDKLPKQWTSLIVIPDSYLYQLPIGVLPVSPPNSPVSYGSAKYMIEQMNIHYLNSLKDLYRTESQQSEQTYKFYFTGIGVSNFDYTGDESLLPLPNASQEVQKIAEMLDDFGKTKTFLDSEATPLAFKLSISDSRIIHIATHSKISDKNPLFSTIYLHPGITNGSGDSLSGHIFAYQLFNMDLESELIVLNSCESASGKYLQGTGIMGFSRALRYAGAQSLVLNLWGVNDQLASDFTVDFYKGLSKGKAKPAALREAKIYFMKNRNANPHYWGVYILFGNPQPVVDKFFTVPLLVLIAFLIGALAFLGIWLVRNYKNGNRIHFGTLSRKIQSLKGYE